MLGISTFVAVEGIDMALKIGVVILGLTMAYGWRFLALDQSMGN